MTDHDLASQDTASQEMAEPDTGSRDMADLGRQLLAFINQEISLTDEAIEVDTDLLLTGAVDSLGVMSITHWIEENLGFDVDATDITLDNFQTVQQTLDYCRARLN